MYIYIYIYIYISIYIYLFINIYIYLYIFVFQPVCCRVERTITCITTSRCLFLIQAREGLFFCDEFFRLVAIQWILFLWSGDSWGVRSGLCVRLTRFTPKTCFSLFDTLKFPINLWSMFFIPFISPSFMNIFHINRYPFFFYLTFAFYLKSPRLMKNAVV